MPWFCGACADFLAGIMGAVADHGPAIVGLRDDVQFVAASRAVLDDPEHVSCGIDGGGLGIAVAVLQISGLGTGAADKGVILWNGAVRVDADDLAEMLVEILSRGLVIALAQRDEELAVR